MSLCAILLMSLLFCSELIAFLSTDLTTDVAIDVNSANTVRLNFNVTFLDLHCDYVSIDVLDSLGTNRQNITKVSERSERALMKTRILVMNPAKWLQT